MNLWNGTFRIELCLESGTAIVQFSGSLKGAIRSILCAGFKGHGTAVIYTADGHFLKEIGW